MVSLSYRNRVQRSGVQNSQESKQRALERKGPYREPQNSGRKKKIPLESSSEFLLSHISEKITEVGKEPSERVRQNIPGPHVSLVHVYSQSKKPQNSHQMKHSDSHCLSCRTKFTQDYRLLQSDVQCLNSVFDSIKLTSNNFISQSKTRIQLKISLKNAKQILYSKNIKLYFIFVMH